jgi:hypothetical protein
MKTQQTELHPEIAWEKGDHIDTFCHEKTYMAIGISYDGREWEGTWIVTDGHHDEITDIELLTN